MHDMLRVLRWKMAASCYMRLDGTKPRHWHGPGFGEDGIHYGIREQDPEEVRITISSSLRDRTAS